MRFSPTVYKLFTYFLSLVSQLFMIDVLLSLLTVISILFLRKKSCLMLNKIISFSLIFRFCFNSVPLKVKEKVNLNLKDIVIKKKE